MAGHVTQLRPMQYMRSLWVGLLESSSWGTASVCAFISPLCCLKCWQEVHELSCKLAGKDHSTGTVGREPEGAGHWPHHCSDCLPVGSFYLRKKDPPDLFILFWGRFMLLAGVSFKVPQSWVVGGLKQQRLFPVWEASPKWGALGPCSPTALGEPLPASPSSELPEATVLGIPWLLSPSSQGVFPGYLCQTSHWIRV